MRFKRAAPRRPLGMIKPSPCGRALSFTLKKQSAPPEFGRCRYFLFVNLAGNSFDEIVLGVFTLIGICVFLKRFP